MKRHIVFIFLFLIILISLVVVIPIRGVKSVSYIENRDLQPFPPITFQSIIDTSYQQNLEKALSDQLVFGENFKSTYNYIKSLALISMSAFYTVSIEQKPQTAHNPVKVDNEAKNQNPAKHDGELSQNSSISTLGESLNENASENTTSSERNESNNNFATEPAKPDEITSPLNIQGNTTTQNTEETDPNKAAIETKPDKVVDSSGQIMHFYDALTYNAGFSADVSYKIIPRGANILEINSSNHLLYAPVAADIYMPLLEKRAACYNKLVKDHPDVNFYLFYIETDIDADFFNCSFPHNILNSYISLLDPKIKHDKLLIQSVSDYQSLFFKTDHHWNAKGQFEGYKKAIQLIKGENEELIDISIVQIEGLKTNGSKSRIINDFTISDDFTFLWADLPSYSTCINGKEGVYGKKSDYLKGNYPKEDGFNHYGNCNGWDYGIVEYDFNQPEKDNMLMFIDSFGNSVLEFIAAHFNKTYVVDLRYYEKENGAPFNFKEFITENDVHEVLFFGPYYFHTNELHLIGDLGG